MSFSVLSWRENQKSNLIKRKCHLGIFENRESILKLPPKKSNERTTTKYDEICFQKTLLFVVGQLKESK